MEQPIVSIKNLKKYFHSKHDLVKAVDGVDLEVYTGAVFGFLGPNGAGKTTTLRVLTTLMVPDSGEVTVAGLDVVRHPDQVRRKIGYVSQAGGADHSATGKENLVLQGQLYGLSTPTATARAKELIGLLELSEFSDRIVSTYSGGQRRRLDVALGLMNKPIVLFLDEPTTGLDPQNRANLWVQIRKLKEEGTTIFLTTHYLEEADALCDTIAIIDNGKIVAMGTPQELKKQVAGECITISIEDQVNKAAELIDVLSQADYIREINADGEYLRLYVDEGATAITEVIHILEKQKIILKTITLSAPSLDDVFLRQTGRSLRDLHAEEGGQS